MKRLISLLSVLALSCLLTACLHRTAPTVSAQPPATSLQSDHDERTDTVPPPSDSGIRTQPSAPSTFLPPPAAQRHRPTPSASTAPRPVRRPKQTAAAPRPQPSSTRTHRTISQDNSGLAAGLSMLEHTAAASATDNPALTASETVATETASAAASVVAEASAATAADTPPSATAYTAVPADGHSSFLARHWLELLVLVAAVYSAFLLLMKKLLA